MFCRNCGHELEEGDLFCPNCGTKTDYAERKPDKDEFESDQPEHHPKKRKSGKPVLAAVIIGILLILALGGGAAYATIGLNMQKDQALQEVQDSGFLEYEAKAEKASEKWDKLGVLDVKEKQKIIGELRTVKNDLDDYIQDQIRYYESVDMSKADETELSSYEKEMKQVNDLAQAKTKKYAKLKEAFDKLDEIVFMYIEPEKSINIQVQQVDASEFPKIRLYVNVEDPVTGEVPENLDGTMFYIRKADANATYVRQKVTEASQLNEMEALKVDMVADVSGSMEGSPLTEAKSIMNSFVNSMQFDAGDQVELTSFATGVRLEQEFCDDPGVLNTKINQLTTGDMTSLYDALYTSVERVAAQSGARCVIAFTDGLDNYSNCTKNDVIAVAQRYHVPVFIIGIGNIDASEIRDIADQTGGHYYSVGDVYSMESIYQEIYRMEKELYLLEFEDSTGATVDDQATIQVGYHSEEYGGECDYTYQPNVLLSADSQDIYQNGPEAVVEQYLKNFPDAVTRNDFSLISDYLKKGSDIYKEQESYVQRDITEQLDSYELTDISYNGDNNCVVSTRETYYVQVEGEALQLMTQECQYALEKNGDQWEMTAFVDLKVVSRIKQ